MTNFLPMMTLHVTLDVHGTLALALAELAKLSVENNIAMLKLHVMRIALAGSPLDVHGLSFELHLDHVAAVLTDITSHGTH